MEKTLKDLARLAGGRLANEKDENIIATGVSKDTRSLEEGNLYIPIIGENFDGHDFVTDAMEKGAAASLWQEDHELPNIDLPLILVKDSLDAFQDMAKNYREELDIPVIAITGSNGKTSTKDILKSVLGVCYRTHVTRGNENNEIGLPLTILSAPEDTEIMVVEMGTESFGEIELLSQIARPNIAVITNIGDSHLDKLKTKENVAKEKMTITSGLRDGGILIYNKDDGYLRKEVAKIEGQIKTLSFGQSKDAKYIISDLDIKENRTRFTVNGAVYQISGCGVHQALNAAVSIIISQFFNIGQKSLARGLANVSFTSMRNEIKEKDGFTIIDDSYKANPQNLLTAIEGMNYHEGRTRKIAVLGDMLDLGEGIDQLHIETIAKIDPSSVDYVLLYGEHMKKAYQALRENFPEGRLRHFDTKEDLAKALKDTIIQGSLVLVKGSRAMRMEEIIDMI